MFTLVPILSTVLPIIASVLLFSVVVINLYINIRRKFSISVNCWFCNSWTKVPYDDRNNFNCPTCLQYNGFNKDGGYNKIIPEQHDELMNKSKGIKNNKSTVSNGLCALCNHNQQLKIFQLANFVPLVDENYDVEIQHFQEQLEKAYKLCKKCDRVLKKTLSKQNAWIFGNRIKNMCTNGISKVTNQIRKETSFSILAKIDGVLSTLLVVAVIFTTVSSIKFLTNNLSTYIPKEYLPLYKNFISVVNSSKVLELAPFAKNVKVEPYTIICGLGLSYHLAKTISRHTNATKINQLLCWIILFLVSWVRHSKNYTPYVLFIEGFSCIYLLGAAFASDDYKPPTQPTTGRAMRKLVRNLEYTCSDITESDFENVSSFSKNCTSSGNSSDYLNSTLDVPLQHNHTLTASNVLNSSFMSAKSTLTNCDKLNKSLNNLHLGGLIKSPGGAASLASFALKRPKPVLSPPKFQNVNSWVAGGFWRENGLVPVTNLSRSSSQSSGFGSQHNENVQFVPLKSHLWGDFDKRSNSEFSRLSPSPTYLFSGTPLYPNLQRAPFEKMGSSLIKFNEPYQRGIENWSDRINAQASQGFKELSLHSNN